ncbi:MAG: sodium/proton-translocating pyrophosphatase, partial [Dehalococcoidia bacterium]
MIGLYLAIGAGALALLFAVYLTMKVLKAEEGTKRMQEIGAAIQEGANAFLQREYMYLGVFVLVVFGALLAMGFLQDTAVPQTAIAYLAGAIASAVTGFVGMRIAVKANMRTAAAARTSLNKGLRVAFSSGGVMGISVV